MNYSKAHSSLKITSMAHWTPPPPKQWPEGGMFSLCQFRISQNKQGGHSGTGELQEARVSRGAPLGPPGRHHRYRPAACSQECGCSKVAGAQTRLSTLVIFFAVSGD